MGEQEKKVVEAPAESGLLGVNAEALAELTKPDAKADGKAEGGEKKPGEGKSEIELMKDEISKMKTSTQSRIDQLVADTKAKDEVIKNLSVSKAEPVEDPANDLRAQGEKILDTITDIEVKIGQAQLDGDTASIASLVRQREKSRLEISALENEYQELRKNKTLKETDIKTKAELDINRKAWNDAYVSANEQFGDLIVDGKLDAQNPVIKKAFEIMLKGAKPSKFLPEMGVVNPKYDHANGPLLAILEAKVALSKDKTDDTVKKAKKEINDLKSKEQLLDSNLSMETAPADDKILREYREAVQKGDFTSPAIKKFLNSENKRAGLI